MRTGLDLDAGIASPNTARLRGVEHRARGAQSCRIAWSCCSGDVRRCHGTPSPKCSDPRSLHSLLEAPRSFDGSTRSVDNLGTSSHPYARHEGHQRPGLAESVRRQRLDAQGCPVLSAVRRVMFKDDGTADAVGKPLSEGLDLAKLVSGK